MRCLFHIDIWDFDGYGKHISVVKRGNLRSFVYVWECGHFISRERSHTLLLLLLSVNRCTFVGYKIY